jgi:DNA-directed RNA polymerase specialized sigma24 family protein
LHGAVGAVEFDAVEVLALNDALERLAQLDARQTKVVELRPFGGLSLEETAAALGLGLTTVKADWRFARAGCAVNCRARARTERRLVSRTCVQVR